MPEDPAYAAIRALRQRLADLEAYAAAQPPPAPLADSIADAMAKPPLDRKTRDRQNLARYYSPTEEGAFRARERDPAAYDAAQRAAGGDLLGQAIGRAGREAHVKLGRALPTPEED